MTLQEQLIQYMREHNKNNVEIARKTGVAPDQIGNIVRGKKTPMINVKRLADKLDPIFEQHVEYKICECGVKFIPSYQHRNYHSEECNKYFRGHRSDKQKAEKHEMPKVNLTEYNEKARQNGLSYGQLQGRERMLMGMVIR